MSTDEFREIFCTIFQVEKYFIPQIFEWMARYIHYVKAAYLRVMELTIKKTMTPKSTVIQKQFCVVYTSVDPTKIHVNHN